MADAPFGLSFGNPRAYMGSSGLGEAVNDYKKFATAQMVEKSGLKDFLNDLTGKGGYKPPSDYTASGGVVPPANYSFQAPQGAVAPTGDMSGLGMKQTSQQGLTMPAPIGMSQYQGAQSPYDMAYKTGAQDIGKSFNESVESGKTPFNSALDSLNLSHLNVDPQAQRDIPVPQGGGYTPQLGSGMDYQKVPGYGKLQQVAKIAAGFMV